MLRRFGADRALSRMQVIEKGERIPLAKDLDGVAMRGEDLGRTAKRH